MQIQLEGQQADALSLLMIKHQHSPVLLTQQGTSVYASFDTASYTIDAEGVVTEEDFGEVSAKEPTANGRTIEGHHVDWMEDENDPGRMGVWMDDGDPIGSVWMSDHETWFAETHFGGGFSTECDSFDAAVLALFAHAVGGGA